MSSNNQLIGIALVREDIKEINQLAGKIYMTALNAMLKARRTSSKNQGYTRVTSELRKFSMRMESSMRDLSLRASEIVRAVAVERTRKRITDILLRTNIEIKKRNDNKSSQQEYAIKMALSNAETSQFVTALYHSFLVSVDRLCPLCHLGLNVAVLAKVEAMYVAEDSQILHDIAQDMEDIIEKVEQQLETVSSRLAA